MLTAHYDSVTQYDRIYSHGFISLYICSIQGQVNFEVLKTTSCKAQIQRDHSPKNGTSTLSITCKAEACLKVTIIRTKPHILFKNLHGVACGFMQLAESYVVGNLNQALDLIE